MLRNKVYVGLALIAAAALGYCLHPAAEKTADKESESVRKRSAPVASDRGDAAKVTALRLQVQNLEARLAESRANEEAAVSNAIARAMAQQTPIMLLDEPLSNLDVAHRYEIMDILAKLNRQGVMILIILHDFSIALEYATHAMLMQDGKILNHDVIKAVLSPENLRNCFHLTEDFVITEEGNIFKTKQ